MKFWDYGNSFLLQASRAGANVGPEAPSKFRYPSYVQDIMGDIFSLGFGPYRWVCTSGDPEDLRKTDKIAEDVITRLLKKCNTSHRRDQNARGCYVDNHKWIVEAGSHKLVVGSQARILYADEEAR